MMKTKSETMLPAATIGETAPRKTKRNAAVTRQRILDVAMAEFAEHGFSGSRIDRISTAADVNVGMIYHYFGNKDDLYLAALEASYRVIRERERTLKVDEAEPVIAMKQLIEMTFDFLSTDPHFVRLIMNENLLMGKNVRRSDIIPHMTRPLLHSVETLLKRGQTTRIFHREIDPEDFYVSMLGLCIIHVSNRYTLSSMFQHDFAEPDFLERRRAIVIDILLGYLTGGPQQPSTAVQTDD